MIDDMAVYIANLGKYNEGYLVGAWFTFPIDEEDVKEKIGLNEQYLEEVVEHKDDIYYYPDCETMTDVAYYYIDELQALGDIPPSLQNYIDYEAYGRDLDMGGCFIETSRGMCEIPY